MGAAERSRKEKEELKEKALQKEILSNQIKVMKDIEGIMSLPEYKSFVNLYKETENYWLVKLCEVGYKNKQGEIVYVPASEIQLRQRIFNAIKDWNCLPDRCIEAGKKAEMELEDIAKKEKEELENKVEEEENRDRS